MGLIDALFLGVIDILSQLGKIIIILGFLIAVGLIILLFVCLIWGLMLP